MADVTLKIRVKMEDVNELRRRFANADTQRLPAFAAAERIVEEIIKNTLHYPGGA